ncbi:hypothetical protein [Actinoplanes sp. NPDC049265]|uniref:hypothetical protein n=1 Tax=Actinoplanes sp. NPDC049265 TaxID=3363902 RepID=UPI0037234946
MKAILSTLLIAVQAASPLAATDIHPGGFTDSVATDVNGRDEVILTATVVTDDEIQPPRAFVWRDGRRTELRPLPGGYATLARDINEHGVVVGFSQAGPIDVRPCLWRHGKPLELAPAGIALAVNDRDEVVGDLQTLTGSNGFLWARNKLVVVGTGRSASGINNRTQVIGVRNLRTGRRGFLWDKGTTTDLGTLGGLESVPADINERGWIVGTSQTAAGVSHAFLWRDGRMTDLGPGGAVAVNDDGLVVGSNHSGGSFRWRAGRRTELAGSMSDVNERGWIAGSVNGRAVLIKGGRTVTDGRSAGVFSLNEKGTLAGAVRDHATVWR